MSYCVIDRFTSVNLTHWGRDKNCRHFANDIFKCIFLNYDVWISLKISLKFVPGVRIYLNELTIAAKYGHQYIPNKYDQILGFAVFSYGLSSGTFFTNIV